ncbi:hypothetical protein CDAR_528131 [Caerostris darwini]|uniref:Uncharacterized protein n=1 Tax=Caerostris darwini TaxID=1538125 RepID=A0AAV4RB23_9ARAC|nr:hypothetical protein CDAR_528131 [Caerostris darwini]
MHLFCCCSHYLGSDEHISPFPPFRIPHQANECKSLYFCPAHPPCGASHWPRAVVTSQPSRNPHRFFPRRKDKSISGSEHISSFRSLVEARLRESWLLLVSARVRGRQKRACDMCGHLAEDQRTPTPLSLKKICQASTCSGVSSDCK